MTPRQVSRTLLTTAVATAALIAVNHSAFAVAPSPFGVASPESGGSPIGGPLSPLFLTIALYQQQFYAVLIAAMSALKENPWSAWLLMGVSFLYGIFHAAGPGHGKAVISGYVVANRETVKRGILLSFAAAFVQGTTAVLVVGIAGAILRVTAVTMTAATDWFEIASYALIAAVGAWLLWSKTFGGHHHAHAHIPHPVSVGAAANPGHGHHRHDHAHGDAHHAHRHGHQEAHHHADHAADHDGDESDDYAVVAQAAAAAGRAPFSRAWSAILAVGIRPCSGALIILVFALSQGLFLAGIAATYVMAIGTGLTVASLATLAASARGVAVRLAGAESPWTERVMHAGEITIAAAVLIFGLLMLGGSLSTGLPAA
jgi:nickel/cobalt transporter (NicO) family protein